MRVVFFIDDQSNGADATLYYKAEIDVIVAMWSRIELSQLPVEHAGVLLVQGPGRMV
jgi:hypothetical protein